MLCYLQAATAEKKLFRLCGRKSQHALVKRAVVRRAESHNLFISKRPGLFISKRPGPFVIGSKGDQPSRARRSVSQPERHQCRRKLLFLTSRRKVPADKDFSSAREFLEFPPRDHI